jgi:hypothetical protein
MGHRPLQRLPLDILHHDVVSPRLREKAVNARNAGMTQLGQQTGFGFKAGLSLARLVGIGRVVVVQQLLDHAGAVESARIRGEVKGPHPPFAQGLQDAIAPTAHHMTRVQGRPLLFAQRTPALLAETSARPVQVPTARLRTRSHDRYRISDSQVNRLASLLSQDQSHASTADLVAVAERVPALGRDLGLIDEGKIRTVQVLDKVLSPFDDEARVLP